MVDLIKEGDYVIAKSDSFLRVVQVCKDRPLFLGKRKIRIGNSVGQPYGSLFEIKSDGRLEIHKSELSQTVPISVTEDVELKDNRALIASDSSQKLSSSDIEAFKAEGVPGEEIVKIIVENSSSFKEKSLYSQEKYLKKKQLKYHNSMHVLKPNARLLAETFYLYSPQKICNLRIDSLSQMLTFCNVMSGGNFIVVDTVLGLLTASVLERIGTAGAVIHLLMTPAPPSVFKHAVSALNLTKEHLENHLYFIDVHKVLALKENQSSLNGSEVTETKCEPVQNKCEPIDSNLNDSPKSNDNNQQSVNESPSNDNNQQPVNESPSNAINQKSINEKKFFKQQMFEKAKKLLLNNEIDALLIAIKHHPSCVLSFLDFLAYSRPFAIYSMYQEPLIDCYAALKKRGDMIMLNISETWMRKYQVLPERTHPEYSMSSNSGFLLTGLRVEKKMV